MQMEVKTEDDDGNIIFEGTLSKREVEFCLNVGVNFLLANGASPFIKDADEVDENMIGPGSDTVQ